MDRTDVLIVGGGISGITSAVELAETGLKVVLQYLGLLQIIRDDLIQLHYPVPNRMIFQCS